jgi:Cu2+-exporting ATPase
VTSAAALADTAGRTAARALCVHCANPTPRDEKFCCAGCAAAFEAVSGLGLEAYYAKRDPTAPLARPAPDTTDYAPLVRPDGAGWSLHAMVEGITCAACVWLIEQALKRQPGVLEARVSLTTRRLSLRWTGAAEDAERLARVASGLGYRLAPYDPARIGGLADAEDRRLLRALGVAGFGMANVMLLSVGIWAGGEDMGRATRDLMHWASALIALPTVAYAGRPFFASAWAALSAGRTNMDVPISIGVGLAAAMSLYQTATSGPHAYFDSCVALLFFLLIGRYLDRLARGQARKAIENLVGTTGAALTLIDADGRTRRIATEKARAGDIVLIAPGERIGVDGVVVDGISDIDAALIDGESAPRRVRAGAPVHAGTLNLSAPLRVRTTAVGEATLLAEIRRLIAVAERGRDKYVALADRVARAYAPAVHTLAAATFLGWFALGELAWQGALMNAVAVLIITCPCALGLAVPVVQVVASGRLLRAGLLFRSATALERLAEIDTVVLDKTGTLTFGRPTLEADPTRDPAALRIASEIAATSRHPLARALAAAVPDVAPARDVVERPGFGLTCGDIRLGSRAHCGLAPDDGGSTEMWLTRPGQAPVRFGFADALRPDAAEAVRRFRALGLAVEIVSGDRRGAVAAVARQVGIEAFTAEASPVDKAAQLEALARKGRKVLMIGDGLNDAPALAAAHVSIAPGSGADIATVAADAVLARETLAPAADAVAIARRAGALAKENLALAVLYNALAVPLAMAGLVTPIVAAGAMSSSSILVILNALRLGRVKRETSWTA